MTPLPKHLEEMRDELAEKFPILLEGYTLFASLRNSEAKTNFRIGFNQAASIMLKDLESMAKALEEIEIRLSHCAMTSFPINVRELDGSISQHRPKSNEGHAYDKAREALKNYREKYGG